jgi:signal transduction histidine kinase
VCERLRALPDGDRAAIVFVTAQRDVETFDRAQHSGGDDSSPSRFELQRLMVRIVASGAPRVIADRTRFAQILMNFRSNAIKYGRPNGRVELRAELMASVVQVTVADDGIGIPADKRDRIFEPFQRAGQEAGPIEGTGIGLTISKRLAELMHGSVGFTSEVCEMRAPPSADRAKSARAAAPAARPAVILARSPEDRWHGARLAL